MSIPRHDTPPSVRYTPQRASSQRGELSLRERELQDLVNRRVVTASTLDGVLSALFEDVAPVFACDRIGLAFLDDQGERLTATHVVANYRPLRLKEGYSAALDGSSLAAVIARGVPRLIGDLEQYLAENPASGSTRLAFAEGVRSSMTCPLSVDGNPVGVLFFSSQRKWAFGELEVRMLQSITDRLSSVIERAWHTSRIEASNRAYFEMLGFVAHELRGPVAGLAADAQQMRAGLLGPTVPRQVETLGGMISRAERLLSLVDAYVDLAHIERGDLTLAPVVLADVREQLIDPALAVVSPAIAEKNMRLVLDAPAGAVSLQADPTLLRIALVNLLSNAARFGYREGEIRVTLRPEREGVLLSVWNEGPGFPDADRHKLFRRFSRLRRPALIGAEGAGVGLYTAWRVVRLHGGRLSASSEEGLSAEFTLWLPSRMVAGSGPAFA